ncbi:MAG: OmpA family protein [Erythrobacter sp.]|nr:OmpA family protein [Erythrobacter sp.]
MKVNKAIAVSAILGLLAACSGAPAGEETAADPSEAAPNPDEPVSILRPDVEQPDLEPEPLEPLNAIIGFPEGGSELDADAVAALEQVLASGQLASGAPITLRSHSDSGGTDEANADASEARGLAVAAWLIGKGVVDDRIEVIVFGEQNPIEPNALPDGSPNEAGRAANRRVEVLIVLPSAEGDAAPSDESGVGGSGEAGD